MESPKDFFVLDISASGEIIEILHQPADSRFSFSVGANLKQLVEEGSREKLTRLLISLREQGRLASWEVFLKPNHPASGQTPALYLGGLNSNDRTLLYGGSAPEYIKAAEEWLRGHAEKFSAELIDILDRDIPREYPENDDRNTFDEMTRLYGELAAMQRELAKKQVQLEQLNATISRYATSLEDMVEDRTRQLRESEARFRGIFEFSSLGIAILDEQGSILSANQALLSILARVSPRRDMASIADVLYRSTEKDFGDFYKELSRGDRAQVQFETELDCLDGSQCWVEVNFFLVPLEGGGPPIAINLVEDITSRKDSEQALIQAEKLTTVGKIAASLAHEINNPLQAIMGNLDLASESLDEADNTQRHLRVARDELGRVSRIVSELRSAGRKPVQRKKSLAPVEEVINTVAGLVRKRCQEKGIDLKVESAGSLPLVLMDSEQIEQVLLNLVVNALEAMPAQGMISISTRHVKSPAGAEILVSNNGEPIPKAQMSRLFEPFYTTKEEGLGLGLHISRQIMNAHGGTIDLVNDSELTTFRIFLPEPVK